VIEEGLDVPDCNAVFYYGDITSYRSLIQARGRARKKGSKFYVIYLETGAGSDFYRRSKLQELNMKDSLKRLETEHKGKYIKVEIPTKSQRPNSTVSPKNIGTLLRSKKNAIAILREATQQLKPSADMSYKQTVVPEGSQFVATVSCLGKTAKATAATKMAAITLAAESVVQQLLAEIEA